MPIVLSNSRTPLLLVLHLLLLLQFLKDHFVCLPHFLGAKPAAKLQPFFHSTKFSGNFFQTFFLPTDCQGLKDSSTRPLQPQAHSPFRKRVQKYCFYTIHANISATFLQLFLPLLRKTLKTWTFFLKVFFTFFRYRTGAFDDFTISQFDNWTISQFTIGQFTMED